MYDELSARIHFRVMPGMVSALHLHMTNSELAETTAEILAHVPGDDTRKRMTDAVEACLYTSTAMGVIGEWLADMGDEQGAAMFAKFRAELAAYEAATL